MGPRGDGEKLLPGWDSNPRPGQSYFDQSISQSISKSVSLSISESMSKSVNQSEAQSVNQ